MREPGDQIDLGIVSSSMNYLLRRAAQRFKEATRSALRQNGISTLEFTAMSLIKTNDTCILRTLAEAIGVEPPAMNRLINSLEDKQLAVRHKLASDARFTSFKLTETGEAILSQAAKDVSAAEADELATLEAREQASLIANLRKFI